MYTVNRLIDGKLLEFLLTLKLIYAPGGALVDAQLS